MPLPKDPKKREEYLRKQRESHIGLLAGENHPMFGKHHTADTKQKISKANKGKLTGETAPFYGKRHTAEAKRKMSESMKGRYSGSNHPMHGRTGSQAPGYGRKGADHPNWVGDDLKDPYGRDFTETLKESIRERDGNECVLCGAKYANKDLDKLHVHHIDFSKDNHDPDNLISLCTGCHTDAHRGVVAIRSISNWEELLHN